MGATALSEEVSADWWSQVQKDLALREYEASVTDRGLQAPNRAHDLRTYFGDGGIAVVPRSAARETPSWRFAWRTAAFGREHELHPVEEVLPVAEGSRVEYRRPELVEWYENRPEGIEQGFTLSTRPEGKGMVVIAGEVSPGLMAQISTDGEAIDFFDAAGARVLRYASLHVFDAAGRELGSHLAAEESGLVIRVDDRDAVYPITVDPLMTSPAWTAESNQDGAEFGWSVATAGDVNGDGYSDVIVGAHKYDSGDTEPDGGGRAFVYHGSGAGLSTAPAWTADRDPAGVEFGYSVATAGDVNGDGFSDVIVGARFDGGEFREGRAFVYHGSGAGLSTEPAWTAESNQSRAEFGVSVATAGDVNGDGFSDVIVGAQYYDNGGETDEGRAFVYHGSEAGLATTPAWTAESNQDFAYFGWSVATAGDVNGDGFSDVIIGAPGEGRAFVYHGTPEGLVIVDSWTSNQAGFFGIAATAGDVNGDGYSDVIVGAPFYDNVETNEGRAFIYHGSPAGLATNPAWTAESNQDGALFGISVATAGDVNGDGYSDVIVGAYIYHNGEIDEGRAFVYHGSGAGLSTAPAWTAESNQIGALFGISVATAGDVNGDGFSDVIVGAPGYDNPESNEGRAFMYHGSAAGLAIHAAWTAESNQDGSNLGISVATAGDVNGDGFSDVIVGANLYDNGEPDEGRAFAYHGSASGLATNPAWTAESDQAGANFGIGVATAGDVNGDGFSDVIVGANLHDHGESDEGRASVYHGSVVGLAATAAWTAEGNQVNARLGRSVATAGDVNGDGFSDVLVGSPLYDNDENDEGRVFAYHGSMGGLAALPAWTAESNQDSAFYGISVAAAGDVNADGFSDAIVGAHFYDNGETNEGRAFAYHGSPAGLALTSAWIAESDQMDAVFGVSVGTAGDVNGDGFSDVIVGAHFYDNGDENEGRAFAYHGSPDGLATTSSWTGESGQPGALFGSSTGTAGDVNGDGFSDVIIGARFYDNIQSNEGGAFTYHGSAAGLAAAPAWTAESDLVDASFGISVATAGDVNGDGFSDVIVGAHLVDNGHTDEGRVFLYYGNAGDGLDRIARQARAGDTAPIQLFGLSDSPTSFRLKALGRTPAGRGRVRLEWEVKPLGTPFDGNNLGSGPVLDTGAPAGSAGSAVPMSELVNGLTSNTAHHWRLRIASSSPFFSRSPWLTLPGNAPSEADVRTAASSTAVAEQHSPQPLWLESSTPNPFSTATQITYSLPQRGPLRLAVYDVLGRDVARLAGGIEQAGRHTARWDGRDARGRELPAGVYFLRLEFAGSGLGSRKIVIAR